MNKVYKWLDITYGDTFKGTEVEALQYALSAGNGQLIKVENFDKAKILFGPFKKRPILEIAEFYEDYL